MMIERTSSLTAMSFSVKTYNEEELEYEWEKLINRKKRKLSNFLDIQEEQGICSFYEDYPEDNNGNGITRGKRGIILCKKLYKSSKYCKIHYYKMRKLKCRQKECNENPTITNKKRKRGHRYFHRKFCKNHMKCTFIDNDVKNDIVTTTRECDEFKERGDFCLKHYHFEYHRNKETRESKKRQIKLEKEMEIQRQKEELFLLKEKERMLLGEYLYNLVIKPNTPKGMELERERQELRDSVKGKQHPIHFENKLECAIQYGRDKIVPFPEEHFLGPIDPADFF